MAKVREIAFQIQAKLGSQFNAAFTKTHQQLTKVEQATQHVSQAELKLARARETALRSQKSEDKELIKQAANELKLQRAILATAKAEDRVTHSAQQRTRAEQRANRTAGHGGMGGGGAVGKLAGVAATVFSLELLREQYQKVMEATDQDTRAETNFQTLMRKAPSNTQPQIDALRAYAENSANLKLVNRDVAKEGMAQLATFQLTASQIKTLTPVMLDLAVRTHGVHVNQEQIMLTANQMGKVFTGQVGALRRVGVSFDKVQEKIMKTGTQEEKTAMLAKVLAQNFGGVNAALAKTPEGQMVMLGNQVDYMRESLGKIILPLRSGLVNFLVDNLPIIERGFSAAFAAIPAALNLIRPIALDLFQMFQTGFAKIQPIIDQASQSFAAMGNPIQQVYDVLRPVIDWVVTEALPFIVKIGVELGAIFAKAWPVIQPVLSKLMTAIGNLLTSIMPALNVLWAVLKPILMFLLNYVLPAVLTIITKIIEGSTWMINAANKIGSAVGSLFSGKHPAASPAASVAQPAATRTVPPRFSLPGHAWGGLQVQQHLAMIAEGNKPELILPLSNPARTQSLMSQHGLGGGNFTINLTVHGGNNPQETAQAVRGTIPELTRQIREVMRQEMRVSYAG